MTRVSALALAGVLLAGCGHKDKDAPLAFAPADTPYVFANLEVLDENTRQALLAQADAQLPAQVAQMNAAADHLAAKDAASANVLRALAAEFKDNHVETFAQNTGLDLKGHSALYGLGLSPVLRFDLADPKAFEGFIARLETAYGKKFDVATIGAQSFRKYVSGAEGTEVILAIVGKQAVATLLPADAPEAMLRQALGLDRPAHSLLDDGRLTDLAKAKSYQPWAVGDVDLNRALPLIGSGTDPLFKALYKAHAESESAKTGEPVANLLQVPASCQADATRIAARVPQLSFGYTRLDAKHQDVRMDVALADDITKAFAGLKVELPGLGADATAPFELSLALPMNTLRTFWAAQAAAVADKPFTCPALDSFNDNFAQLGDATQKAAIPPIGDLLGLHLALDSFTPSDNGELPKINGRLVIGTNNPAGMLAMGQMASPILAKLKLTADGKPQSLPADVIAALGQPGWAAMGDKALALAIGAGEDSKLVDMLKQPGGDAGGMMRMHLSGDMYMSWVKLMEQKADSLAKLNAAMDHDASSADSSDADDQAAALARSKAQIEAMRAQAARTQSISADVHVDNTGMIITSQTELK
ncbi:MAG: hypothetical protein WA777_12065 [Rhodanobacter sp.]